MNTARPEGPNFFAYFMTGRQYLTRRTLALLGGCSLAAIIPIAWVASPNLNSPEAEIDKAAAQSPQHRVTVVTSRLDLAGPDCLTQSFTGVIKPKRSSMLAAKDVGRVESVLVQMGDRVEAGDLLIQLDHTTLDAELQALAARLATSEAQLAELRVGPRREDVDQATARVDELTAALALRQASLQRNERLISTAAISRQEFDDARYGVDMAQAQLASAEHALAELKAGTRIEQLQAAEANVAALEADLRRLDVRIAEHAILAPFAGTIQSRLVDEGVVVSPGQSLLQIVESGFLEVHVGLPAELTQNIKADELLIEADGLQLACTIDRLSPSINEATRTRDIVLKLTDPSSSLVLGAAVNVLVRQACTPINQSSQPNQAEETFWVPRESLGTAARGLWAVLIARPEKNTTLHPSRGTSEDETLYVVERRQVEMVRAQGEWAEVRGPLTADELLVTQGIHRIAPGQIVVLEQ